MNFGDNCPPPGGGTLTQGGSSCKENGGLGFGGSGNFGGAGGGGGGGYYGGGGGSHSAGGGGSSFCNSTVCLYANYSVAKELTNGFISIKFITSSRFSFTGSVQSYTVPSFDGILRIQAYGAQGIIFFA